MRFILILAALIWAAPIFASSRCDVAADTQFSDVGDVQLAYQSVGLERDPALLLVMGLGGQLINWPD